MSVFFGSSTKHAIAYITHSSAESAAELARKLVRERLVACVNIIPTVQSIYSWKGAIEDDSESLMILKTCLSKRQEIIDFVQAEHGYETPEIIFLPVIAGSPKYLSWVSESCGLSESEEIEEEEECDIPLAEGVAKSDVVIVMDQAGVSRAEAIRALNQTGGDIVDAVVLIQDKQDEL